MPKLHSILFRVTQDALIVANTGKPFTREGVISLCHLYLSPKPDEPNVPVPIDNYNCCDLNLIGEIANRRFRDYEDINTLNEHVSNEGSIEGDYRGRLLLELLQNANDAAAAERPTFIGAKGIGFKSVLEISEEPSVYSGPFSFCFSKGKTRGMVGEIANGKEVPVFRIPHKCERKEEIEELLKKEYVTVIRLPFKTSELREQTVEDLKELSAERLLFCPYLNHIKIDIQTDVHQIKRELKLVRHGAFHAKKSKVGLITIENGQKMPCKKWRQWMRIDDKISASIALPLAKGKEVKCSEKPLHVFFPSEEELHGVHALIHASFKIESNRKHLAAVIKDEEKTHAANICAVIKDMTRDILCSVPAETGLLAFGKACGNEDNVVGRMCQAIAEAVRETAFIPILGNGGKKCKPSEVRLWSGDFGNLLKANRPEVRAERLLCGALQKNRDAVSVLEELGAEYISNEDYFRLLRYCKNASADDCRNAIKFAVDKLSNTGINEQICEDIKNAPFWFLETNRARSYIGEPPILMERPKLWPTWLPAVALAPSFKKAFKRISIDNRELLHCAPSESKDFIADVLAPYCDGKSEKWWRDEGAKILRQASEWLGKKDKSSDLIIGQDDDRNKVGKIIHVPTEKGGWRPAIECYAGSKWGGCKQFDDMEEVILLPLRKWEKTKEIKKEQYIPLLRWLGVSWMPKFYMVEGNCDERVSHLASEYIDNILRTIRGDGHNIYTYDINIKEQFYFDEDALMKMKNIYPYEKFADMLINLYAIARRRVSFSYFYYTNRSHNDYSFALYQLKQLEWIRCKPGIMGGEYKKPCDIFAPGKSLGGLLPEIIVGTQDDKLRYEFLDAMKNLGMNENLPESPAEKDRMIKWMNDLSNTKFDDKKMRWDEPRGVVAQSTYALYSHYLKHFGDIPDNIKIPCLRRTDKGEFIYFTDQVAYWLDNPYLYAPTVRSELLRKDDINIFICSLTDGENSGLGRLSDYLYPEYERGILDSKETTKIEKLYRNRILYLNSIYDDNFSKDIKIQVHESISLTSKKLPNFNIPVLYEINKSDRLIIYVSAEDNPVRALAAALASLSKSSVYKVDFEVFLAEGDDDGCLRRLRDDYGKTEDSLLDIQARQEAEQAESDSEDEVAIDVEDTDGGQTSPLSSVHSGEDKTRLRSVNRTDSPPVPGSEGGRPSIGNNSGGGGKGPQHESLQEKIFRDPKLLGINNSNIEKHKERKLLSGDMVDVVFESENEYVIVEVKVDTDFERGLYQCVKYRAVVNAMLSVGNISKKIRAILVIATACPGWLDKDCKKLPKEAGEIEIKTVSLPPNNDR